MCFLFSLFYKYLTKIATHSVISEYVASPRVAVMWIRTYTLDLIIVYSEKYVSL